MKFLLHCLFLLSFSVMAKAQCPVINAAMVNACGASEGKNEFVLFTTTVPAFAGNYTFYYGTNSVPSTGLPVNILSGGNAIVPTGTGSITSVNGCTIINVTSPVTIIPAGSMVLFIPADFDVNYDVSSICASGNLYVVYIDGAAAPSTWNAAGVLPDMPLVTAYLEVRNSAVSCPGAIVSYANGWAVNASGNTVWWDAAGVPTYGNNGCAVIAPPVTINNIAVAPVCEGSNATTASFTATGGPDQYNLTWDAAAQAAGFVDVLNASLPASPFTITVPVNAAATTYTASLTAINSVTGGSSNAQAITLTITTATTTPLFSPVAPFCKMTVAPLLPAISTNGIPGTWSPAVISNTVSATYSFTPAAGYCATAATLPVTILPLPAATISGTTSICSGTGSNITFNGTPNASVTYNINGGSNQTVTLDALGTGTVATGNLSSTTTYNLISAASATCSASQSGSAIVTVQPLPVASVSGTATICSGTGTNIIFNGTPNATVTYNINGGSNQTTILSAAGTSTVATGNLSATTTYNLVRAASATCSVSQSGSVIVTVLPLLTASINSATVSVCSGTGTNILFNGTSNATITYTINGGANQTVVLDAAGTAVLASGNLSAAATYTLISISSPGPPACVRSLTGSVTISVNALPTAGVSGTATICEASSTSITFTGTPNAIITYNINGGANQTVQENTAGSAVVNTGILLSAATYSLISVTNTGANTCSQPVSGSAIISLSPLPTAVISGTTTICSGTGSNVNFNGTPNATVTYKVNGGANQVVVLNAGGSATVATGNITATANYQLVSVRSATSPACTVPLATSAIITVNALPIVNISGNISICNGLSSNISFKGTPNTNATYTTDGINNQTVPLDATGAASINTGALFTNQTFSLVSVEYASLPTCTQSASGAATVIVFPVTPPPAVNSPVIYCENEKAIPLTATGSNLLWYTIPAGGPGAAAAPLPATTPAGSTDYYVTQTLNGCESQRSGISVVINPTPVAPSVSLGSLYRCGPGPTTIKATAPGMVKFYGDSALTNYLYTGIAYNAVVSATTTFYITSTENNCISPIVPVTVLVFPMVTQITGFSYSPSTVCQGSPSQVPLPVAGFTPGGVYSAPSGLSIHSITGVVNPAASTPGTYTVKYVLGAALCTPASSSTATITITKNPTPVTSFSYASPVCSSASNPSPVPGAGFTPGGVYSAPAGVTVNATTGVIDLTSSIAGTYIITYRLAATACTNLSVSTATITITTPTSPTVGTMAKRCGSGNVILDASGTGTIKWYADAALTKLLFTGTSYSTAVTATTNFYLTNTVSGCVSATTIATATVVPVTAQVTAFTYNPAVVCAGNTLVAPVPAPAFASGGVYSAPAGISIDSITGVVNPSSSIPATYLIKYTLPASACALTSSSSTSITISKTVPTVTTFTYPTPVCITSPNPSPVTATGFTQGGVFSSSAGLAINATTGIIDIAASTPATYTVTYAVAQTACGAGGTSSTDITITSSSAAPVTTDNQRCGSGLVTVNATGNGTITWYADAALSTLLFTGPSYSPNISTTTNFYVTNTVGNCVSTASVAKATVNAITNQVTAFSYSPSIVCAAIAPPVPVRAAGFATGGIFSAAAGLVVDSSTGMIDIAASTPGTYTVKYTLPAAVCAFTNSSTATITVLGNNAPLTSFSYATPVCINGKNPTPVIPTGFTTGGVFSSPSGLTVNAVTGVIDLTKSKGGTYSVTYTVLPTPCTPGSSSKADIFINSAPLPPVATGGQRCGNGVVNLKATGSGILNWYDAADLISPAASGANYNPSITSTTTYYVTAFDGNCTSAVTPVSAIKFPVPAKPSFGKYSGICAGDNLLISPGSYDHYLWQDNSTASGFIVKAPGIYSVVVTTADGCSDSASITIELSHNCDDILFPTAFSPNNDGLNDQFGPLPLRNLSLLKNYSLRIYNRYGQVVFSSTNPFEKWDGSFRGQPADTGSYMWRAEYIYNNGSALKKEGAITIVH
ncbi:gliding motility-associated C-terminal domain-containing protein [Ferruginibacter paludis]|uniref:Ig-like domain-containing protein n=1 Tax=Ferruginibacter paludis TaxID=1310417 RepID=UPI0025B5CB8C|nr:gliding motility-associated C-terminal domain-containing protein [Ferruginibacter paludis]MDN3656931.1 gliding motility-associated C-terminal domain-containing protein [Ferruginibacter paludis]